MKIFKKEGGLMSKIPDGKCSIGDEGYVGQPKKAATRNTFDSDEIKEFKRRAKSRQETVNARLKSFGILSQVFRTKGTVRMKRHQAAFEACCVLVQTEIDNGSNRLFKV
jgi:hypothetical protein